MDWICPECKIGNDSSTTVCVCGYDKKLGYRPGISSVQICPFCNTENYISLHEKEQKAYSCAKCNQLVSDLNMEAPKAISDDSAASKKETQNLRFEFTANAMEYFNIWIVNIFLSIITFGIYSAWAKVRTNRYFYAHTKLDGAGFDYHANPIKILKGRLLVAAVFILYIVGITWQPYLLIPVLILFFFGMPWAVVKSMLFRTRNSSYRNIRFNFTGEYGESFFYYIVYSFFTAITFGLLGPFAELKRKQFIFSNCKYGRSKFKFSASGWDFYKIYIVVFLMGFIYMCSLFALIFLFKDQITNPQTMPAWYIVTVYSLSFAFGLVMQSYLTVKMFNLLWSSISIEQITFTSTLSLKKGFGIIITNALAVLFTFGLLTPWALIRWTKYKLDSLSINSNGDLDAFVGQKLESVSATGEELGDFFDLDIGIGF